jgi:REP element-mobilizing transposase RayT
MHRLYAHLVWTTRNRLPLITSSRAHLLDRYLRITARRHQARIVGIGMVTTHVHLLLRFEPTRGLSTLVQALKGGSATICNREILEQPRLRWARGYSLHSVGERQLDAVLGYLAKQPEHHPLEAIPGRTDSRSSHHQGA